MSVPLPIIQGRAASENPTNRFVKLAVELDLDHLDQDPEFLESRAALKTEFLVDSSRSILARNDSPDIGFTYSINPYRGCEHGCVYCYAHSKHARPAAALARRFRR